MPQKSEPEAFFPAGAIAFFIAMIAVYAALWMALYSLMAHRG